MKPDRMYPKSHSFRNIVFKRQSVCCEYGLLDDCEKSDHLLRKYRSQPLKFYDPLRKWSY